MKNLMTSIALLLALLGSAQSKQDRVMLQQIAALKTYSGYIVKGYRIAKDGLNLIGRLKEGELGLHQLFFEGLENISPTVRHYPKVAGTLELSGQIISLEAKLRRQIDTDLFYGNEKAYIRRVLSRVLKGCEDDLEALQEVISDSRLIADDAQRLKRIDALYTSMEDRYIFAKAFYSDCAALAAARQQELMSIRQSKQLYNINATP